MKLPDFVDKHYKFDRLSMKTAVFMDKVYKNDNPSTEHSVSVDGFLFCQGDDYCSSTPWSSAPP
jgi:hypothetical protein